MGVNSIRIFGFLLKLGYPNSWFWATETGIRESVLVYTRSSNQFFNKIIFLISLIYIYTHLVPVFRL